MITPITQRSLDHQVKRSRRLTASLMMTLLSTAFIACVEQTPQEMSQDRSGKRSHRHDRTPLTIRELNLTRVKASGMRLIALTEGLHKLSSDSTDPRPTRSPNIVLVHGYASRGYEWVGPALTLAQRGAVYFYRWDWSQCPDAAAERLMSALKPLTDLDTPLEVYGHSYGGVITSVMAARYTGTAPLTANLIAAPLAGHPRLEARCEMKIAHLTASLQASALKPTDRASAQVTIKQWRTRKELDGAFKDLDRDPQRVMWRGEVVTLPERYKSHRLGHNWSISWVADQQLELNE